MVTGADAVGYRQLPKAAALCLRQAPSLNKACRTMAAVMEDDWEGNNYS